MSSVANATVGKRDCLAGQLAFALILVVISPVPDDHFAWMTIGKGLEDHLQVVIVGNRPEKLAARDSEGIHRHQGHFRGFLVKFVGEADKRGILKDLIQRHLVVVDPYRRIHPRIVGLVPTEQKILRECRAWFNKSRVWLLLKDSATPKDWQYC